MASGFYQDNPIEGISDLDDDYVTESWLVDQFVGNNLKSWGDNTYSQLGNNTTTKYSSPIQVGSLTNWKRVDCGSKHTVAIKTDGSLWSWGYNTTGQLGNNTSTNYSSPIQVGSLTNWKQVACCGSYTLAISSGDLDDYT